MLGEINSRVVMSNFIIQQKGHLNFSCDSWDSIIESLIDLKNADVVLEGHALFNDRFNIKFDKNKVTIASPFIGIHSAPSIEDFVPKFTCIDCGTSPSSTIGISGHGSVCASCFSKIVAADETLNKCFNSFVLPNLILGKQGFFIAKINDTPLCVNFDEFEIKVQILRKAIFIPRGIYRELTEEELIKETLSAIKIAENEGIKIKEIEYPFSQFSEKTDKYFSKTDYFSGKLRYSHSGIFLPRGHIEREYLDFMLDAPDILRVHGCKTIVKNLNIKDKNIKKFVDDLIDFFTLKRMILFTYLKEMKISFENGEMLCIYPHNKQLYLSYGINDIYSEHQVCKIAMLS